jgi:hypothetical protein
VCFNVVLNVLVKSKNVKDNRLQIVQKYISKHKKKKYVNSSKLIAEKSEIFSLYKNVDGIVILQMIKDIFVRI